MYTVEVSVVLRPGHRLTDDEITDLVEAIVDDLDTTTTDPSVSTVRDGSDVRAILWLTVESYDPIAALAKGSEAMLTAFQAAGVAPQGTIATSDLHSEVRPLLAV